MASKYRKIDPRIWKDEKFISLSERDKLIIFYLMTAQVNRIGLFNFSPAHAAEDLGIKPETFRERFANVCQTFNWEYDPTFRVMYIPTWWRYNPPENANVLKGNLKDIHDLPNTPLINRFLNNIRFIKSYAETFTQTLLERYPKHLPKRSPKQEQEQEQEQNFYCSESERSASEPKEVGETILTFPLIKKDGEFPVYQSDLDQWQDTFPGIDVLQELRCCRQWSVDNPSRRKTKSGIRRHISGWLRKEQDRKGGQGPGIQSKHIQVDCSICKYNQKDPCLNLSEPEPEFDPSKCDSFRSIGGMR